MECKKCTVNIPSEFEYVLSQNICPKCGNKLMADAAMKVYVDLRKRLNEVEFVMDKAIVCERVAMFLITNYEIVPMNSVSSTNKSIKTANETAAEKKQAIELFKAQLASLDKDNDLSSEEIRAQEAARAEEIAIAREMGMDVDDLDDNEEVITGVNNSDRLERLKKLATSPNTGVKVHRVGT